MRVTLAALAFTSTLRVVDRVHDDTAHRRANALVALGTGLAVLTQVVLVVPDFADDRAAFGKHLAHFTRTQANGRVLTVTSNQLHGRAGTARNLSTLDRTHLDAVNRRTKRRSEETTSELTSLLRHSYAVFCLIQTTT